MKNKEPIQPLTIALAKENSLTTLLSVLINLDLYLKM